jgi:hypothetical protein
VRGCWVTLLQDAFVADIKASNPEADVVVFAGKLTAAESVALFASADVVVGVHGGALANIVVRFGLKAPGNKFNFHHLR